MKSSHELGKEIQALQAKVEAIVSIAKQENRELSAEEATEVDAIVGNDQAPGQIAALRDQKERALRVENAAINIVKEMEAKEAPKKLPAKARATGKLQAFHTEEDAYASGQFVLATMFGNKKAKAWCRDNGIQATMSGTNNPAGGFLVPEPMEASIIELRERYGVFRQESTVWPMSDSVTIVPRVAGDVASYYVGEASEITQSDMTINQIKLEAKKLATLTTMSSELNEDAVISMAELLTRSIAYEFALEEDKAGFLGDGTGVYGGIVGLTGALAAGSKVTATSRQTFSALTFADFESVIGACKMWPGMQAKWYVSQAGWAASMQRLANAAGGVTMAELASGMSNSFMGYPVVKTQVLESRLVGTTGVPALFFGDLRMGSYLGTRRGVTITLDSSRYFEFDLLAIKATQRYDIVVHDRGTASASGGLMQLTFG